MSIKRTEEIRTRYPDVCNIEATGKDVWLMTSPHVQRFIFDTLLYLYSVGVNAWEEIIVPSN